MPLASLIYYCLATGLLGAIAIWVRSKHPPLYFWAKGLPMFWILFWLGWHYTASPTHALPAALGWLCLGLILGTLGDLLLLWPRTFLPGYAAFLGGHLAYIIAFGYASSGQWKLPLAVTMLLILIAATYAGLVIFLSSTRKAAPLVGAYATIIASMLLAAVNLAWQHPQSMVLLTGAILFCVSDGLWSWNRFVRPIPQPGLWILGTYYSAQALIAWEAVQLIVRPVLSPF
ncbi:MAG: lysoplasmalogenase [Leptospiraceae bacterium]|nr:lysoplasmalogenase [Leptospiraceae bacterium]